MNKILLIYIALGIQALSLQAQNIDQSIFNDNMETIKYDLPELIINDSTLLSDIDSLVIRSVKSSKYYDEEKYFRVFFKQMNGHISVVIEQSKYPVKQRNSLGYFNYNDKTFIVSGMKIPGLFEISRKKRIFTYKDYIQPSIFMIEDDIPNWNFRFQNGRLYPDIAH